MNRRLGFLALLTAVIVAVIWWQAGGGKGVPAPMRIPPGRTVAVNPVCGPPGQVVGPFAGLPGPNNTRRPAQVLVQVVSTCGEGRNAEIEIEQADGSWTPVREHIVGVSESHDDPPKVGSWYVVAVPDTKTMRLSCPAGSGTCSFNVTDVTVQVNRNFSITPNSLSPGCSNAHGDSRLLNLSDRPVNVSVTFTSLCNDAANNRAAVTIHKVAVQQQPVLPNMADTPVQPAPRATPQPPTQWRGQLDAGYRLEASCTGTQGTCTFRVVLNG